MARSEQLALLDEVDGYPIDAGGSCGEVFTRRWVAELILDLVGYTSDENLTDKVIVEPSCGSGAFLVPIVERLVESAQRRGVPAIELGAALRAFDLSASNVDRARAAIGAVLTGSGVAEVAARALARSWVASADFLLANHEPASADFVVGNPPYVRLEDLSETVRATYRRRCPTMRGRADLYVGFFEVGLGLLRPGGTLGFICADRWMHNQYGELLRDHVSENFAVDTVLTMHDVDAFEDDVSAYPAVVVLRAAHQATVAVADAGGNFDIASGRRFHAWRARQASTPLQDPTFTAARLTQWYRGKDLWPSASPDRLSVLADLESRFEPLEDPATGTRVGIGVATGCDGVYITDDANLVEADRLVPLLGSQDVSDGSCAWSGKYLVNPWGRDGLVELAEYPRLAGYLDAHATRLRARHVAKKRPGSWFRTIDRVHHDLTGRPKLLVPDIKAASHPVLDPGGHYPHHNLYYVTSEAWDLEVLGGLLLSDIANLFVGAYCVKMRGGTYRFQAQYLRRIRVPDPTSLSDHDRSALADAFRARDTSRATAIAERIYGVSLQAA